MRIIVDRDGTVLDFYEMFFQFCSDLYRQAQEDPPPRAEIVSYTYWTAVQSGLAIGGTTVADRVDEVIRTYLPEHGVLYDGVASAATELRTRGYTLDLISSWVGTTETERFLANLGIRDLFDRVRTRDDLDRQHAARLSDGAVKQELALQGSTFGPDDFAFAVGDSSSDIELSGRLGIPCHLVRTGNVSVTSPVPVHGQTVVVPVDSFSALPRLVAEGTAPEC